MMPLLWSFGHSDFAVILNVQFVVIIRRLHRSLTMKSSVVSGLDMVLVWQVWHNEQGDKRYQVAELTR
jgi:hypothetical protein